MPKSAIREIFTAIVADLHRRQHALLLAIALEDASEVRRIGHAIKGGCAMAGATQAARLGALIENGAVEQIASFATSSDSNHLDDNSSVLHDLRIATSNLERILREDFPTPVPSSGALETP